MSQLIWLNVDFTKYDYYVVLSSPVSLEDWQQQYEIYDHAQSILENNPNEHDLACAIFQLNRAVDFREKLLNKLYKFKKIPGFSGLKHHEAMSEFGIIKPLLKTKLDKIRNNVMHSAEYPIPNLANVSELSEFTWYFLKSTDSLASRVATGLEFEHWLDDERKEWAEVDYIPSSWDISIRGKFLDNNLSNSFSESSLEIIPERLSREDNFTYFDGRLIGPDSAKKSLIKIYFSAQ